ncbi:cysteine desulfurase [Limnospira fusiformis KN01]|uniref:cysteine desulfurase family protein n=1 Tax=Limnospira TaxID=2596745 RepID=UPI001658BF10|nr:MULTISPECIES: cysteine desulfurase family protein [Limnospira]MDT9200180.1 cysteine desulfurase family protein [Limnospira sp. PMC 1042.18]ULB46175.1 cysteine desulfurase [Limnospira fusiformis KN01]
MTDSYPIYLDYHATTPVDPRVAEKILHYMTVEFGNANSIDHIYGDRTQKAVSQAARQVAELVGASPREIIFTSGATESINLAIQGSIINHQSPYLPRIAVSPVEHPAVLDTGQALVKQGLIDITYLSVDKQGQIDLESVDKVCRDGVSLLCVMAANNEIGTIYPIAEIGKIAQTHQVAFLCDGSQAVGKIPINFEEWGITYLAISGHKLYGPKGVGALVARKGYPLKPMMFGGGHQGGMRSGTLNVPGIVGLGEACRLRGLEMAEDEARIANLRDKLQDLLLEKIPGLVVNGDINHRLSGNLHISIPDVPNSAIIARVRDRLAISTGAACSSGVEAPSHVLRAIALSSNAMEGALRIGIGKFTTESEIHRAAEILAGAIGTIRQLMEA